MNRGSGGESDRRKGVSRRLLNLWTGWNGDERRQVLLSLGRWLLTIALLVSILLASGQAALLRPMGVSAADTNSRLSADYSPWEPLIFASISGEVISDALGEIHQNQDELVFQGDFWPGEVSVRPPALSTAT